MIVTRSPDPRARIRAVAMTSTRVAAAGPATPDHVIRTKRVPLVGRDVAAYAGAYEAYFRSTPTDRGLAMLDPAPRVVLDPELGL